MNVSPGRFCLKRGGITISYENVKLWFAKNENNKILTVDEINEVNKSDKYLCPVCGSNLKPKAIESKKVTPHFAHIDASKCNSESQIHFWFKNKFLEKGDKFTIIANKTKEYICKDVLVEQSYKVGESTYRPDVTVLTDCGKTIYFEMAFSNKKKIKDYLDGWLELSNVVVEVDIKQLMFKDKIPTFKALFYNGKCFNVKKNDTYYNTIGKYKEQILKDGINVPLKERIRKLDWFWEDIFKYKNRQVEIYELVDLIDSIVGEDRKIVNNILSKNRCKDIYNEYYNYKLEKSYTLVKEYLRDTLGEESLKYLDKSLIDYGKYMRACIVIDSYYWIEGCRSRSPYRPNNGGMRDSFDIENYTQKSLNEKILKLMDLNLKYIRYDVEIDNYESITNKCISSIETNAGIVELTEKINNRGKIVYRINISPKYGHIDPRDIIDGEKDLSYLQLRVSLDANETRPSAFSFDIKQDIENFNSEEICKEINKIIVNYFNELKLVDIEMLEKLVAELELNYNHCNISVKSKCTFEDIYDIWVSYDGKYLDDFSLTYDGIVSSPSSVSFFEKRYLLKTDKLTAIKEYIVKSINEKLENELKFVCLDCTEYEYASITIGELKFYNKKGFQLPKRCKSCRNKKRII